MSKTIVVTGGTGGIGYFTARELARQGHEVIVTGRNLERGKAAVERLREESGNERVHLATGDLSAREELEALAVDLLARFPRIDVLINNAGYLATELEYTSEGVEMDFAVNVVAPWAFTRALMPSLERAGGARVINVTGGLPNDDLDVENLQAEKGFVGLPTYSHSKRAMEAMSLAQAPELAERGVHLNVVYPGGASTAMTQGVTRESLPPMFRLAWPLFSFFMQRDDGGRSAEKASRSSVWAATAAELEGVSGRYYDTKCRPAKFKPGVLDASNQERVLEAVRG